MLLVRHIWSTDEPKLSAVYMVPEHRHGAVNSVRRVDCSAISSLPRLPREGGESVGKLRKRKSYQGVCEAPWSRLCCSTDSPKQLSRFSW